MNTATQSKISPLKQLYPLPGSKAAKKYDILAPDDWHTAICQPFMGSAARSLGVDLPSYLGDINAAQRSIAKAWLNPEQFCLAYSEVRDLLISGIDLNLLSSYQNQKPLQLDHPEVYQLLVERWHQIKAELFAEINRESVGLAGRYYFFLKASFGQVVRLNPTGTAINSSWHVDKLNGAISFDPAQWCLQMAITPFNASIHDCWEDAISAPPDPANTLLILDPPYGVDTTKSKITACYLDHQISADGQADTLLNLAIAPLKRAIELGYQTIYLCNYRSDKLEQEIAALADCYTVARHDFGECRALGNSNGRLTHGNRKDGRDRGSESIWELRSRSSLQKNSPKCPTSAQSTSFFGIEKFCYTEKPAQTPTLQDFEASLRESARIGETIADNLRSRGIAPEGATIGEEVKGGRTYWFLRYAKKGRIKKVALRGGKAVAVAREQIDRRNQYNWLNYRISEIYGVLRDVRKKL